MSPSWAPGTGDQGRGQLGRAARRLQSGKGRTQDVRARTTRTQGAGGAARGHIPFDDWRPHPASLAGFAERNDACGHDLSTTLPGMLGQWAGPVRTVRGRHNSTSCDVWSARSTARAQPARRPVAARRPSYIPRPSPRLARAATRQRPRRPTPLAARRRAASYGGTARSGAACERSGSEGGLPPTHRPPPRPLVPAPARWGARQGVVDSLPDEPAAHPTHG